MPALTHICVLITRPQPKAAELAHIINAEGGRAIEYPTFSIEDPLDKTLLQAAIKQLHQVDIAIFVSPNAVQKTMPVLQEFWSELPKTLLLAAVGKSTQQALNAYFLNPVLCPEDEFNSEALLSLPSLKQVQGKNIMIFQGETGRGLLEDVLIKRGAKVSLVVCYRRVLSSPIGISTLLEWQKMGMNRIIYTSAEGMLNLFELADRTFHHWLKSIPSLVVSARLMEIAKEIKIETIIESPGAHVNAIIKKLKGKI